MVDKAAFDGIAIASDLSKPGLENPVTLIFESPVIEDPELQVIAACMGALGHRLVTGDMRQRIIQYLVQRYGVDA